MPIGIEVTIASALERLVIARERMSNPRGITRGHVAIRDGASGEAIKKAECSHRVLSTPAGRANDLAQSIRLCLANKSDSKYAGMWLVIEANLPVNRVMLLLPDMKPDADQTPFERVYVVGRRERSPWMRLK